MAETFTAFEARAHFLERVARFVEGSESALFEVPHIVAEGLRIVAAGKDAASRANGAPSTADELYARLESANVTTRHLRELHDSKHAARAEGRSAPLRGSMVESIIVWWESGVRDEVLGAGIALPAEQEAFVQRRVWLLERAGEYGMSRATWFTDLGDTFGWTTVAADATAYTSKEEAEAAGDRWSATGHDRNLLGLLGATRWAVATDYIFLGRVLLGRPGGSDG